jgi:hypothetical protein
MRKIGIREIATCVLIGRLQDWRGEFRRSKHWKMPVFLELPEHADDHIECFDDRRGRVAAGNFHQLANDIA